MIKDTSPQAVESCHDLIKWMLPQIDRFPRVRRYRHAETDGLRREIFKGIVFSKGSGHS